MFRWKKRDEGFEWHTYVRTTIKLRREARRRKAQDLGLQMAEGAKAAGAAADSLARHSAEKGAHLAYAAWGGIGRLSIAGMARAGRGLGAVSVFFGKGLGPAVDVLARPFVAGFLLLAGAIALLAGAGRGYLAGAGLDFQALVALTVGCVALLLGLLPAAWHGKALFPKGLPGSVKAVPKPLLIAVLAGFGVLSIAGVYALAGGRFGDLASASRLPVIGSTGAELTGEARVIGADLIRISGTMVQLAGVDVPHADQRCFRPGGRNGGRGWPCGQDAREALHRLVRGHTVTCEVSKGEASGAMPGRCRTGGNDVAEALVRSGHAFASKGLFASYASAEAAARDAKLGIWAQAEPERPSAWRDRLWSEAKQKAPDGCPIKARARGQERVYLLPWSADYGRVRVDTRRGDRWFCTEDEALAAGWRSPGRT